MATRLARGWVAAMMLVGAASVSAEHTTQSPAHDHYAVTTIRTRAFFHESGRFDERELQDPRLALWNVSGGAGDAGENIDNTLVLVDVAGPSFTSKVNGAIELSTTAEGHPDTKTAVPIDALFSEGHRVTAPFLVYGISCGDLNLLARVRIDGKVVAEKRAVIPFRCGE